MRRSSLAAPRLRTLLTLVVAAALASGPELTAAQGTSGGNNPLDVAGGGAGELARTAARAAAFLSPNGVLGDAAQTAEQAAEVVAAETTAVPQAAVAAVPDAGGQVVPVAAGRGGGGLAAPPPRTRAPPAPLDGSAGAGLPVPPGGRVAEAARAAAALLDRMTERGDVSPPADRRSVAGAAEPGGARQETPHQKADTAADPPAPPATRAARARAADGSVPPADWDELGAAALVADTPEGADAVTTRASPAAQGLAAALGELAASAGLALPGGSRATAAAATPPPTTPDARKEEYGDGEPPRARAANDDDAAAAAAHDPLAGPSVSTIADRQQGARFALDGAEKEKKGKTESAGSATPPPVTPFTLAHAQAAAGGAAVVAAARVAAPRLAVAPWSAALSRAAADASPATPPPTTAGGPFALLDVASGTKLGGGGGGAAVVVPPRAAPASEEGNGAEAAAAHAAPAADATAEPASPSSSSSSSASLPDAPTRAAMAAAMVAAQKGDDKKEDASAKEEGSEPAPPAATNAVSWRAARPATAAATAPTGPLSHHGGPTLMDGGTVVVVPIFYGPRWSRAARAGLVSFLSGLGGSKWWAAATAPVYPGKSAPLLAAASPVWVTGPSDGCWAGGEGDDGGTSSLSPTAIASVAACVRERGRVGADPSSALFLVLGDSGTAQEGGAGDNNGIGALCADHCGWHAPAADAAGRHFALAFAGSPARCPAACAPQWPVSGSNSTAAEESASLAAIAHNVAALAVAAAADPLLDGWHGGGRGGLEAGTACAWAFPPAAEAEDNALVTNAVVGGRAVLLPGVLREDGSCAAVA